MRPTLQPRLQASLKHGNHRRFHSMIMQVCEFDLLSFTPLKRKNGCVRIGGFRTKIISSITNILFRVSLHG